MRGKMLHGGVSADEEDLVTTKSYFTLVVKYSVGQLETIIAHTAV